MKIDGEGEISDFDQQVEELEASITRLDFGNKEMEEALKKQVASLSTLEVEYDGRIALLSQCKSQDIQAQVDHLQTAALQDLNADQCLHEEVTTLQQMSAPLEDNMVMLMRRVGKVLNQWGTSGNDHKFQVLPLPDWCPFSSKN